MQKVNIYCDESCHLEHDREKFMVIGGIRCDSNIRKQVINDIYSIKEHYSIPLFSEIKWNQVSPCNLEYFKSLVDFFFMSDYLKFRAIIIDKSKINNNFYNQTQDDFYYKMYYQMLIGLIDRTKHNYIYIDKKDTKGYLKIQKLQYFLCQKLYDFDKNNISRIQCVDSSELPILQLADLLIGAIGYKNRNISSPGAAKPLLVDYISKKSGLSLTRSTFPSENKFNLFFINLQQREDIQID